MNWLDTGNPPTAPAGSAEVPLQEALASITANIAAQQAQAAASSNSSAISFGRSSGSSSVVSPSHPLQRAKRDAELTSRMMEAKEFVEAHLGLTLTVTTQEEFMRTFDDGVLLCRTIPRVSTEPCSPAPGTPLGHGRQALQNFANFATACANLGISRDKIVTISDIEKMNVTKFVDCLLEIKRLTAPKTTKTPSKAALSSRSGLSTPMESMASPSLSAIKRRPAATPGATAATMAAMSPTKIAGQNLMSAFSGSSSNSSQGWKDVLGFSSHAPATVEPVAKAAARPPPIPHPQPVPSHAPAPQEEDLALIGLTAILQTQNNELKAELEALKAEKLAMANRLAEQASAFSALQLGLGGREAELQSMDTRLKGLLAEREAGFSAVKKMQLDWSAKELFYKDELTKKATATENLQGRIMELMEAKHQIELEVTALRTSVPATAARLAELEATIQSLHEKLDEATHETGGLRATVDGLSEDNSQLTCSLEKALARVAELETSLAAATARKTVSVDAATVKRAQSAASEVRTGLRNLANDVRDAMATTAEDFGTLGQHLLKSVVAMQAARIETTHRLHREHTERRRVFNLLQQARGNIRVFCRVRPLLDKETQEGEIVAVEADSSNTTDVLVASGSARATESGVKLFSFDHVFGAQSSQEQVFDEVSPMVISALDGYHSCIFAYGQTGSGKTFTMEGTATQPGVNHRALRCLFEEASARAASHKYTISVSMVEIYNERVRDLLGDTSGDVDLEIRQGPNGVYLPGSVHRPVASVDAIQAVMAEGRRNRAMASTNMNEYSSRSHSLLLIDVVGEDIATEARSYGKLVLVDLAGSERASRSGATGDRLKEAQNINRSLSALGDVIAALMAKSSHVPFRNSKLTYLLQDSLGKDNKALMIVQVSPTEMSKSETVCSLTFAQRVSKVEMGAAKKTADSGELARLRSQVHKSKEEVRNLEEKLQMAADQVKAAKSAVDEKEAAAAAVAAATAALRKAEDRLAHEVEEKDAIIAKLKANVATLAAAGSSEKSQVSKDLAAKEAANKTLKSENEELNSQLDKTNKKVAKLESMVTKLQTALKTAEDAAAAQALQVADLKHQVAAAKKAAVTATASLPVLAAAASAAALEEEPRVTRTRVATRTNSAVDVLERGIKRQNVVLLETRETEHEDVPSAGEDHDDAEGDDSDAENHAEPVSVAKRTAVAYTSATFPGRSAKVARTTRKTDVPEATADDINVHAGSKKVTFAVEDASGDEGEDDEEATEESNRLSSAARAPKRKQILGTAARVLSTPRRMPRPSRVAEKVSTRAATAAAATTAVAASSKSGWKF